MGQRVLTGERVYSRAELMSDAAVHVVGLAAALMAVPVLITLAVFWRGDVPAVLATGVYGAALIAMLLCSALYNMIHDPRWKGVLQRLDHTAIYIKIAGTYTPFTVFAGSHWLAFLTGLWAAACAGSSLKVLAPERFRLAGLALYLAMGWAGVAMAPELFAALAPATLWLILGGGVVYTAGGGFFLMEMMPFHNTIWHVFVLVASVIFFAAVLVELAAVPL